MNAAAHAHPNIRIRVSAQSVQRAKQAAGGEYRIVNPVAQKNGANAWHVFPGLTIARRKSDAAQRMKQHR
jgi:hypothetical protein